MIELKNVSKSYAKVEAVRNLSLAFRPGEIFGLLGPNGAGKSTTIRMIMNIIGADSGEILFDGRPISEQDKDRIGYMPEERGLYKNVAVEELLVFLAELKGFGRDRAVPAARALLERFDLLKWKDSPTDSLSKGMSQKIQFISTILHEPQIIILDEPFSGLDPVSADRMCSVISGLRDSGRIIIFSTHIMDHAEKICSRIAIMKNGEVKTEGTLGEVKSAHGKDTVLIDFEGSSVFIKDLPYVEKVLEWPGSCEVSLIDEPDAHRKLLAEAGSRLNIRRFEVRQPSLHRIFVDLAGEGDA